MSGAPVPVNEKRHIVLESGAPAHVVKRVPLLRRQLHDLGVAGRLGELRGERSGFESDAERAHDGCSAAGWLNSAFGLRAFDGPHRAKENRLPWADLHARPVT